MASRLVVTIISEGVHISTESAFEHVFRLDFDSLRTLADLVTDLCAIIADVILGLLLRELLEEGLGAVEVLIDEDLGVVVRALGALFTVAVHVVPAEFTDDVFEFTSFTKKTKSHIKVGAALVDVPKRTMLTSFAFLLHEIRAYLEVVTEVAFVSITTRPHCLELIAGLYLALIVGVRTVITQSAFPVNKFLTHSVRCQLVVVRDGSRNLGI